MDGPASCATCGAPLAGRFCADCGEKRREPGDLALKHYALQLFEAVSSLDGKLWRTLRLLYTRPGMLSDEFVRGARVRSVRPLQLFLLVNVLYFLLQPLTGVSGLRPNLELQAHHQLYSPWIRDMLQQRLAERGLDERQFALSFDAKADQVARSLILLLVPLMATGFWLMHAHARRRAGEHLALALEFASFQFTFAYLFLTLILTRAWGLVMSLVGHAIEGEALLSLMIAVPTVTWCALAYRRFYADGPLTAWGKALATFAWFAISVLTYRLLVFLVTMALT